MEKQSERVQNIINKLTEKITSENISVKHCLFFSKCIEDLYFMLNKIKIIEATTPVNYDLLEQIGNMVLKVEVEIHKKEKE
jgi:hypothetical protein